MKLFQSLLVAPAALGLLTPMTVTANELNITEVSDYSSSEEIQNISDFNNAKDLAITKSRVDGLEARFNNLEAGAFSETTTASFSSDFAIGALEGKGISTGVTDGDESLQAYFGFQIDLTTSFTGEDSLDISIDAGNGADGNALSEFDLNGGSGALTVDGISYSFPLGEKMTAMVGDNIDGSALFTTACAYGGPSNTLDDCGNVNAGITNGGAMAGASFDIGNGFTAAVGYAGDETQILTEESMDAYGANVAYSNDNSGISLTYGVLETAATTEDTFLAVNGYYSLDNGMSISAGYEVGDIGANSASTDESINYFVGVNGEVGPGELGVALGTSGGQTEGSDTETMYEAYYSYPINDGMTITPLIYVKEQATAGTPDLTGIMVKTSFSF